MEEREQHRHITVKEKRRLYYEKNKFAICYKTLNIYCIDKIEKVRSFLIERVDEYTIQYPFEDYERYLEKQLFIHNIYPSQAHYHDCYDAGMMAYLYSIHRCAEMSYSHTNAYIKKLIRIYIICALVVHDDTKNLCQINNLRLIRLDADSSSNKF